VKRRPPRWQRRLRGTAFRRAARRHRARRARESEDGEEPDSSEGWDRYASRTSTKVGAVEKFMGWLFPSKRKELAPAEHAAPTPSDDPVRVILAMPRGAARLDAFEDALDYLDAGTPGHTRVALAFHQELTTLAERADVDLTLLKSRTEACAEALITSGEMELAGQLLRRIGKQHRAAELFVATGSIEELEAAHAEMERDSSGRRLDARLAYERFEGRFLVGLRRDALLALDDAVAAWPDHPVYREIRDSFTRRLLVGEARLLWKGADEAGSLLVRAQFPLIIGRAESAALAIKSPLISREHVEILRDSGELLLRNLQTRGRVAVDDVAVDTPRTLGDEGTIDLAGVEICYQQRGGALLLWATQQPDVVCAALLGESAEIPVGGKSSVRIGFDPDDGRALVLPHSGVLLAEATLEHPTLLLANDKLLAGGVQIRIPQDR